MRLPRMNPVIALAFAMALPALALASRAHAQTNSCSEIIQSLPDAFDDDKCGQTGVGTACYVKDDVTVEPDSVQPDFDVVGEKVSIDELQSVRTESQGAVLMVAKLRESGNSVRIFAIGEHNSSIAEGGTVITMEGGDNPNVCEQSPSLFAIQADSNDGGSVFVNNVEIELKSTAVVTLNDLLIDNDLRTQDEGMPFCDGFSSDCEYGFGGCTEGQRLVRGPLCRGRQDHAQIEPGIYRVTIHGTGTVLAAAVDRGLLGMEDNDKLRDLQPDFGERDEERGLFWKSQGPESIDSGLTYTFTWPGLQEGGTGFELLIDAAAEATQIDRMAVEFMQREKCESGSQEPGVLRISNVEGTVSARLSEQLEATSIAPGEWVRVHLCDGEPVVMSEPLPNDVVAESSLVTYLTEDVLPSINAPVPDLGGVLFDRDTGTLALEAGAYSGAAGENGNGIESVEFVIFGASATEIDDVAVYKRVDRRAPYCGFGEKMESCKSWNFEKSNGRWPGGQDLELDSDYRVRVRSIGSNGKVTEEFVEFAVPSPRYPWGRPPVLDTFAIASPSDPEGQ